MTHIAGPQVALGALVAATSGRLFAPELKAVPWYAWLGGFYGAVFVVVAAFGAPKIGVSSDPGDSGAASAGPKTWRRCP